MFYLEKISLSPCEGESTPAPPQVGAWAETGPGSSGGSDPFSQGCQELSTCRGPPRRATAVSDPQDEGPANWGLRTGLLCALWVISEAAPSWKSMGPLPREKGRRPGTSDRILPAKPRQAGNLIQLCPRPRSRWPALAVCLRNRQDARGRANSGQCRGGWGRLRDRSKHTRE